MNSRECLKCQYGTFDRTSGRIYCEQKDKYFVYGGYLDCTLKNPKSKNNKKNE